METSEDNSSRIYKLLSLEHTQARANQANRRYCYTQMRVTYVKKGHLDIADALITRSEIVHKE